MDNDEDFLFFRFDKKYNGNYKQMKGWKEGNKKKHINTLV